jgi:thymidylate synthase (FAD)
VYNERVEKGVAREQARKDLPLSTYTEAYWKIDLHNLLHFLVLRMDNHAQFEIRSYANVIGHEIVRRWCPIVWEAFIDYRLRGSTLTRLEIDVIRAIQSGNPEHARELAVKFGILPPAGQEIKRNREREDLEAKLTLLKIPIPWK